MYCSNCGKKIVEGSRFCSFCGNPVSFPQNAERKEDIKETQSVTSEKTTVSVNNNAASKGNTTNKKKSGKIKSSKGSFDKAVEYILAFNGRLSNGEFWRNVLLLLVSNIAIIMVLDTLFSVSTAVSIYVYSISILLFVIFLSFGCRRMHDTGRSGAYILFNSDSFNQYFGTYLANRRRSTIHK